MRVMVLIFKGDSSVFGSLFGEFRCGKFLRGGLIVGDVHAI